MGERIVDRIGHDHNFILKSIHYVIACRERRRVPYTMFKKKLGFRKNQNINQIRDQREWERQWRKQRTPLLVLV